MTSVKVAIAAAGFSVAGAILGGVTAFLCFTGTPLCILGATLGAAAASIGGWYAMQMPRTTVWSSLLSGN